MSTVPARCPVCWHAVDVPDIMPKAFLRLVRQKAADKIDEAIAQAIAELQADGATLPPVVGWISRRLRPKLRATVLREIRAELQRVTRGEMGPDE